MAKHAGGRDSSRERRPVPAAPRRILVVEDSPTQAEHLRALLEDAGYGVAVAVDGQAALEGLEAALPELIVSDVVMPRLDGFALCKAVKASKRTRMVPVVLLTSRRTPADIIMGLEHGADNFITKPFDDGHLLERIHRIFENLEQRRHSDLEMEVVLRVAGRELVLNADKQQMVELLFATAEELTLAHDQLEDSRRAVEEYARTLEQRVAERTSQLAEAEARYRTLVEQIPAVTYVTTLAEVGRLFYVSPQSEHMLGLPYLELLSDPQGFLKQVHPEDRPAVLAGKAASRESGEPFSAEYRLLAGDGRLLWVRDEAVAVRDPAGRPLFLQGILLDITDRKRAEEERLRQQAILSAIVDSIAEGLVVADEQGRFLVWNPAAERILGMRALSAAKEKWSEAYGLFRPNGREDFPSQELPLARALRGETCSEVQMFVRNPQLPDGAFISVGARPLHVPALGLRGGVAVFRDISDWRRDQEQLARQREALAQAEKLAAMGSLLAGVAHELNNPLSVVLGQAGLLRPALQGLAAERADKILRAAERSARIVRNFLALARRQAPERQHASLNRIAEEAIELVAYPLRVDSVEVSTDLDAGLPELWADSHQLHQVLVNLITNAHHALRGRPGPRRVTVRTRLDAGRRLAVLEVADNGPGIPAEVRKRIFEPFFTTKPAGEGTGLGLSLCEGIVVSHGGRICVESEPDAGALFRIELPVGGAPEACPAPASEPPSAPARGRRILVVDDEPALAALLADILGLDSHHVDVAGNGREALARLAESSYELVVSDIRMPVLDGPGLHAEVERTHPGLARRFVFLTGDTLASETAEFLERTGSPSLAKPFDADEARRVVARALARTEGSE